MCVHVCVCVCVFAYASVCAHCTCIKPIVPQVCVYQTGWTQVYQVGTPNCTVWRCPIWSILCTIGEYDLSVMVSGLSGRYGVSNWLDSCVYQVYQVGTYWLYFAEMPSCLMYCGQSSCLGIWWSAQLVVPSCTNVANVAHTLNPHYYGSQVSQNFPKCAHHWWEASSGPPRSHHHKFCLRSIRERERWTLLEFGARAAACLHNLVRLIFATPIQSTAAGCCHRCWVAACHASLPWHHATLPCFPATNLLLTPVPLFTNLGPTSFATRWWLSSVALPNLLRIWKILDYKPCFANLLSSLPSNWRLWRWCIFFCQIIKI